VIWGLGQIGIPQAVFISAPKGAPLRNSAKRQQQQIQAKAKQTQMTNEQQVYQIYNL